mmetsp:Transcript_89655/g.141542  ORF Transcript_89655/g.141542 Transcript_89655/m.141542 type:complete len:424 (-) Transcript_89655:154-1425(-)
MSSGGDVEISSGSDVVIGIILAVTAAALGTLSKQLIAISEHLKKPWLFHIGAGINIAVGPVVDASAYAFAPQVIVAPFACLDVIFNALTAPYTLRWQNEVLTKAHLTGCGLVALGAVLTSIFADAENEVFTVYELEAQLIRPASIFYLGTELFMIITVNWSMRRGYLSPRVRGISLGVIAGVLMGNVFFMKGLIGFVRRGISGEGWEAFLRVTPYICLVCAAGGAIVGHMFMRKGLGEYKGVFMVTIFEGAHISAACLSGCIVMSEMSGAAWWRYLSYWASVFCIIAGMLIINVKAANSELNKNKTFHIAQNYVDENEETALKNHSAPSPIGRALDDQEAIELELGNPLDGVVRRSVSGYEEERQSPTKENVQDIRDRSPAKRDEGDNNSNVSTSTPEGDLAEVTPANGQASEYAYEAPVFLG